ncbi:MAG: GDSL-type esterase/lipase family protein [Microthrixaceae bacterium]
MQRGLALGVPALALAAGAGVVAQVRRVANAPLPHFEDHDPSGTYGSPDGDTLTVTVLGDSTVTGPGLGAPSHSWIAQMVDRLPHRVELRSFAKGGSRVRDVLLNQAPQAVTEPTDVTVVAVGANDVFHATPGWQVRRDLEALLAVLAPAAPVVTLGVGDLSVIPRLPWALRSMAAWRSGFVDAIHSQVCEPLEGVVRVPVSELSNPYFAEAGPEWWTPDMFHPSVVGHRLWADLFEPYMHTVLDMLFPLVDLRPATVPSESASQVAEAVNEAADDGAAAHSHVANGYVRCNEHR